MFFFLEKKQENTYFVYYRGGKNIETRIYMGDHIL